MAASQPNSSYSIKVQLCIRNAVGMLGKVASAIGECAGDIGAVEHNGVSQGRVVRAITINCRNEEHADIIVLRLKNLEGVEVTSVQDLTFAMHEGGKISVENRAPVATRADLAMAYTPGVARICEAIHKDPEEVYRLTVKRNMVAVVTDGTAVLGLGDIGPEAALPVMEGKAMLFKEFGGVNAFPICLASKDTDEIVRIVTAIAPVFGGVNLEDIAAPRCFEIEERLQKVLNIPVFHDDQHGTAVVTVAALFNALKVVGKRLDEIQLVVSGVGAAGVACVKMLMRAGLRNVIGCDRKGAVYRGRAENMNSAKQWFAEHTNQGEFKGDLRGALKGADVFLGLSGPGVIDGPDLRVMAKDAIVFAMANPTPEVMPEQAREYCRILATGRSDYPNQINNVLCFPGLFRGVLDCRATSINEEMKLAAAHAIASAVGEDERSEEYIIPSVFNRQVAPAVARAVSEAALRTGVARLPIHSG